MNFFKFFGYSFLAVSLISCNGDKMTDINTSKNLNKFSLNQEKMTIFLGHQSVGNNILDGVKLIAQESNLPIKITEFSSVKKDTSNSTIDIIHKKIGQNEKPLVKIRDFKDTLNTAPYKDKIDVAMMKLCYYDFNKSTDIDETFNAYKKAIAEIKTNNPKLKIIHITTPLVENTKSYKYYLKKVLGKEIYNAQTNKIRMNYNNRLIDEYGAENIFDLALIESIPESFKEGDKIKEYLLRKEYTNDGGHLNDRGKRHVAIHFMNFISNIK